MNSPFLLWKAFPLTVNACWPDTEALDNALFHIERLLFLGGTTWSTSFSGIKPSYTIWQTKSRKQLVAHS